MSKSNLVAETAERAAIIAELNRAGPRITPRKTCYTKMQISFGNDDCICVLRMISATTSAHAASDAFTCSQIKTEITGISISKVKCAPDILLAAAARALLPVAGFLVVWRHRIEDVLCRLPFDDQGQLAIGLRRRLLIVQVT